MFRKKQAKADVIYGRDLTFRLNCSSSQGTETNFNVLLESW